MFGAQDRHLAQAGHDGLLQLLVHLVVIDGRGVVGWLLRNIVSFIGVVLLARDNVGFRYCAYGLVRTAGFLSAHLLPSGLVLKVTSVFRLFLPSSIVNLFT